MIWQFWRSKAPSKIVETAEREVQEKVETPTGQQSHLCEYLNYYRNLTNPQYAVLVTGGWGVGKTFQVLEAIPKEQCYYVSLFGLNSADDVIAAVYAAMFPGKALIRNIAGHFKETTADISGVGSLAFSGLTSALVGAFLRQDVKNDNPIIFDDLERCGLDVKDILGIINLYVEHHGCCVVVIAHDQKLADEFGEMKEKLFGQTIMVEPEVVPAFNAFCSELSDTPGKILIQIARDKIVNVFSESGAQSLRILRHVLEDLIRLTGALSDRHLACNEATDELVRLFAAFDVEWRMSQLKESDLHDRSRKLLGSSVRQAANPKNDMELPTIAEAQKRHKSVDLTSTLIQDDVLYEMLVEGRFDRVAIQRSLDASSYFVKPQRSAPWEIVINFDKLDDETVQQGVVRMQEQFDRREVLESGEMLHIFALRMMMSSRGILGKDVSTVTTECKEYIDDLLNSGLLPARPFEFRWDDSLRRSAYHVGYWVTDECKTQFEEVFRHLISARGKALESELPKLAVDLLKIVASNGQEFFELVTYTKKGNNRYAAIAILAAIDPEDFVAAWLRSPRTNWYWISTALQERYGVAHVEEVSKPESAWINDVQRLLNEEAAKASGLAKLRIQRIIPNVLALPLDASHVEVQQDL